MTTQRAPKQWQPSQEETLDSFRNWKENLIYILSLDSNFSPFLAEGATWLKTSSANPTRGLQDDPESVPASGRKTAVQKCTHLDLILGQIANNATIICRSTIVQNCTYLNDIWLKIREHCGFQTTGSRFLDLSQIHLQVGERYEDLYQRLVSFFDDNLLTKEGGLNHHGEEKTFDEDPSPSLENLIVFLWLERIHFKLASLVKQKYGAELRNETLASIKTGISQALDSLFDELKQSSEDFKIFRSQMSSRGSAVKYSSNPKRLSRYCCLCRAANRPRYDSHFLSQCKFLREGDRRRMTRVRCVDTADDLDDFDEDAEAEIIALTSSNSTFIDNPRSLQRRVAATRSSPHMNCFYKQYPVSVCIDTRAESSLVSERCAKFMGLSILPTNQGAVQADVKTPLSIIREIKGIEITRGAHVFLLDVLVVREDIGDINAGELFLEINDITMHPAKKR